LPQIGNNQPRPKPWSHSWKMFAVWPACNRDRDLADEPHWCSTGLVVATRAALLPRRRLVDLTKAREKSCSCRRRHRTLASMSELSEDDVQFLIESLQYTKRSFESTEYPTAELKKRQLDRVEQLIGKLRRIRDSLT
jgi:hypothetical protein